MHKKLLLTAVAVAAVVGTIATARAASITFTASEDGGATQTIATGQSSATLGPVVFGDFTILATGATQGTLPAPGILQGQTIDIQSQSTTSHTLDHQVLGIGVTGSGLSALLSGFDATGLSSGWTATISTDINNQIIASSTFTGPVSGGHDSSLNAFNLPGTFNASVDFHIVTTGAGAANLGGALSASAAAVPGPLAGAGLPGLIFGGLALWGAWKQKRRAGGSVPANAIGA
jgi:hypothetical protein